MKIKIDFRPLQHLLPAGVVAAAVAAGVLNLDAVKAVVGDSSFTFQEVEAAQTGDQGGSEDTAEDTGDELPENAVYADGTYYGTGQGFRGTITVELVISGGTITEISVTDVEADDSAYVEKAKGVIAEMLAAQTYDVDTISGATYSSKGIRQAVKNALAQAVTDGSIVEEEVQETVTESTESEAVPVAEVAENAVYADGVYTGVGQGYKGKITVQVTISGGSISDIALTSVEADDSAYVEQAKGVISAMLSAQSPNVDTISGATYSSRGIIAAVKNALAQAVTDPASEAAQELSDTQEDTQDDTQTDTQADDSEEESTTDAEEEDKTYKDGTYTGSGQGYKGKITVELVIKNSKIQNVTVKKVEADDEAFVTMAKGLIPSIIKKQSANVDTVSGATYSSRGIIAAVKDALKKAAVDPDSVEDTDDSINDSDADTDGSSGDGTTGDETGGESSDTGSDEGLDSADTDTSSEGTLIDGTYTGTGEGFMGNLTVKVVVKNSLIKSITLTKNEADGKEYVELAKGVITSILAEQSTDVDTVSGATYSSRGIIAAVKDALKNAYVKNTDDSTSGDTDASGDASDGSAGNTDSGNQSGSTDSGSTDNGSTDSGSTDNGSTNSGSTDNGSTDSGETALTYVDGTYTGSASCISTMGMFYDYILSVQVMIAEQKITDISGLSITLDENDYMDQEEYEDYMTDNLFYSNRAANGTSSKVGVFTQIKEKQSITGIDAVASATCSSKAILAAVEDALKQASGQ